MNLKKKIFVLSIFILFISICGVLSATYHQNTDVIPVISNKTDEFGCCSIILQLEDNHTLMSYRRDSNFTADVFIEKVDWHGIPAIKQYKTEQGYFNHVIITNDGWIIGLGGIDDGRESEICENITSQMISKDYSISKQGLQQIQDIKKQFERGHVLIKAPNGNYGFATDNMLKTGKLKPGEYVSIPNKYDLSRKGNISLNSTDNVKTMNELAKSDLYGLDRREIITYDYNVGENGNTTDIYISNDDGSLVNASYGQYIDDIHFNNTIFKGSETPIAPDYKKIGSITFEKQKTAADNLIILLIIVGFVVFVGVLFFVILRLIKFIKYRIHH